MTNSDRSSLAATPAMLTCRAGSRLCAFELAHVAETMRPLRIEPLPGAPDFVPGVSRIRGEPVPVIDLSRLLGVDDPVPAGRFVVLRAGSRRVAVRVEAVVGVDTFAAPVRSLPPLLSDARAASVAALAERDRDLLFVLDTARLLELPLEPCSGASGGDR